MQQPSPSRSVLRPFDHAELLRVLSVLEARYPFLNHTYLGESLLSRPIPLIRLGSGKAEYLYVGTHHGMEWITACVLTGFINDLCEAVRNGTKICGLAPEALFCACSIYILPMLNPDGVEYQLHGVAPDNPLADRLRAMNGGSEDFSHWQANARGVDLNHNYDAGFAEYKAVEAALGIHGGAPTRYSGETPESEPETAALAGFLRFHARIRGVLTLHTQGEEIFSGGENAPPSSARLLRQLAIVTGFTPKNASGAAAYGGLTDWCVRKLKIPAFTLECGKGQNPLPLSDAFPIYVKIRRALVAFPTWR